MTKRKLTIIGAGSAMFTQGFVLDLLEHPGDYKWHIALVDIDESVLTSVAKMAQKLISHKQSDVTLSYTTDRREALTDTDYIVVTIGVGGRRAWEQDVFIPRKYGIMQPVGDTAMPGGISRALRMVPAMVDIAKDIRAICPQAAFLNYSNPMTIICKAISKAVDIPMTGLCIGVPDSIWHIAETAGLPKEECTAYWGGINHCTFIYDFRHRGKNAWPLVLEAVKAKGLTSMDDIYDSTPGGEKKAEISEPFSWWFLQNHGAYTAPGDRHVTEFFTEYFPEGKYYGMVLGKDAYSFEDTITYGDKIHQSIIDLAESDKPLQDEVFNKLSGEHMQLMEMIWAIEKDENKVFSANVPNKGTLPGIADDAIVEVPCVFGAHGFNPIPQPQFPAIYAAYTNRFLACIDVAVEAALTGNRRYFVQAIMMGGYLQDRNAAEKMADELLQAQKAYLPQF